MQLRRRAQAGERQSLLFDGKPGSSELDPHGAFFPPILEGQSVLVYSHRKREPGGDLDYLDVSSGRIEVAGLVLRRDNHDRGIGG